MTTVRCPARSALRNWLAGDLPGAEHDALKLHFDGCGRCRSLADELEPTRLFAALGEPAPPPGLWGDIWPDVEAAIKPRSGFWAGLAAGLRGGGRLSFLAPALAGLVLVVLGYGIVTRDLPGAEPWQRADAVAAEFVYLSNPDAKVTHILLPDAERGTVQVTMVVDSRFKDAF
jgi:hypothetical protein